MKALSLFSGGLDSLLSIKLMRLQNIEVVALFFDTGFGGKDGVAKLEYLQKVVSSVDATLEVIDIKEQFVQEILFDPKHGYGKNFNPCIDCHANMFRVAFSLLEKYDASFVISGEVLAQRPMSQRKDALDIVKNMSGDGELLLRPLSAKLLAPSKPELEGWVDRSKLLALSGRGRSEQMRLAKEYGITIYDTPAGGCLLTDMAYSQKIKEHIAHDSFALEDIDVLKFGRHLRLDGGTKLVIGRDEHENIKLEHIKTTKYEQLKFENILGPTALIGINYSQDELILAIRLVLTYSKTTPNTNYKVRHNGVDYEVSTFGSKDVARAYLITL